MHPATVRAPVGGRDPLAPRSSSHALHAPGAGAEAAARRSIGEDLGGGGGAGGSGPESRRRAPWRWAATRRRDRWSQRRSPARRGPAQRATGRAARHHCARVSAIHPRSPPRRPLLVATAAARRGRRGASNGRASVDNASIGACSALAVALRERPAGRGRGGRLTALPCVRSRSFRRYRDDCMFAWRATKARSRSRRRSCSWATDVDADRAQDSDSASGSVRAAPAVLTAEGRRTARHCASRSWPTLGRSATRPPSGGGAERAAVATAPARCSSSLDGEVVQLGRPLRSARGRARWS